MSLFSSDIEDLDFTTTGCTRPEIFLKTLSSFKANLLGIKMQACRLFLNVDPVPDPSKVKDMATVASTFFREVILNAPEEACFPKAVKWCWSQPETPYFFHLEDDWNMVEPFDVRLCMSLLESNPGFSCVNLRVYDIYTDYICLSPGVFRSSHMRVLADRLSTTANPEQQLRPMRLDNPEGGKYIGFFGTQLPKTAKIVEDLGRMWLRGSGWDKDRGMIFVKWTKNANLSNVGA